MTNAYKMHGLCIGSDVPLDAAAAEGEPELVVRSAERRPIPDEPAPGSLLAALELPGGASSLTRGRHGYTLRINGLCDFELSGDLRVMAVHLSPRASEEAASMLAGGAIAALLALRGHCLLHASAVSVGPRAVAFVGTTGMGKSTVAALCCAAGASLITDDALRVDQEGGEAWCYRGSLELRLRAPAAELAERAGGDGRRSTLDGRTGSRPPAPVDDRLSLAAVVRPVCAHGATELEVSRLRGAQAVLELVRYPRTLGWTDAELPRRDFRVLARLAEVVPVYRASLPWGPPFAPDLGQRLIAAIDLPLTRPRTAGASRSVSARTSAARRAGRA